MTDQCFDLSALRLVLGYPWPLNVRELRGALLAAVDLAGVVDGRIVTICPHHLPQPVREPRASAPSDGDPDEQGPRPRARPVKLDLTDAERELRDSIIDHLRRTHGNVAEVARQMGKGRTQIQRWIARYGMDVAAARRTKD